MGRSAWLETWYIPAGGAEVEGTVLLFPGNGGNKSKQLLAPAKTFHHLRYDTLLVDFRGVGGSSDNTTTLGAREAQDVAAALAFAQRAQYPRPYVLYGVSMGSAAILKAVAQEQITPDAVILELPFARLLDAVKSRLRAIGLPPTPLAELLVFWGSVQHRFNGFAHNPVVYAKRVYCPTLILQGELDRWTSQAEVERILHNLADPKQLVIFPKTGHTLLVTVNQPLWQQSVAQFLQAIEQRG